MKEVLLITDVDFWNKGSGHRSRISALISYLATQVKLTIAYAGLAPLGISHMVGTVYLCDIFLLEPTKHLNSNAYGRRLKKMLNGRIFDTVIIEYIHNTYFLEFLAGEPTVILDAHDIISDRTEAFKKNNFGGTYFEISEADERELLTYYDYVIVLCEPDYKRAALLTEPEKILICPHFAPISKYIIRKEVRKIVFLGSDYPPNLDAINYFIEHIWPSVREGRDIQLHIYGGICHKILSDPGKAIYANGFVTELKEIYEQADVIINPVRFGSGLKIKNIEALSMGVPLVTTSHGSRGLEGGAKNAYLIADDIDGFISSLKNLIDDFQLRKALSHFGVEFVKESFTDQKCFSSLLGVINIAE
jgi:glycosyltransferase involved in cell wall biosynthesis